MKGTYRQLLLPPPSQCSNSPSLFFGKGWLFNSIVVVVGALTPTPRRPCKVFDVNSKTLHGTLLYDAQFVTRLRLSCASLFHLGRRVDECVEKRVL